MTVSSHRTKKSTSSLKATPVIVSLVGARPQFVKLAPLAKRLAQALFARQARHIIVHSGQHYDPALSDVFFSELRIPAPDVNLEVGSGSHGAMTADILKAFEAFILDEKPALVVVYGDTNTTLAGALAAVKLHVPVAHVEAGLRSFDRLMPEEINRVLTDHASDLLLCPTKESLANARREGVRGKVQLVGDVMYEILAGLRPGLQRDSATLKKWNVHQREFALVTAHRAENVDSRACLVQLADLLREIKVPIIFPAHPRTRLAIERFNLAETFRALTHLRIAPPLPYLENLALAAQAKFVMTDSGGLQKESVFLGTPCLTMRNVTEWPETLALGNTLIGLSRARLRAALRHLPKARPWKYAVRGVEPTALIAQALVDAIRGAAGKRS